MEKFICIHGHFYQPPRENPWLEEVELQDSAQPYHDWNERITAECYAPNTASRIVDGENRIIDLINNYSKISFNIGPTLCSWMERHQPDVLKAIIEADKKSIENFSGHGSAIAQVYNHMIMPLANRRDKYTQAFWGIMDFQNRFGRFPEGIWLPETAVDIETLEILAELKIKFTILAPRQARRVRRISKGAHWHDVGDRIDPKTAYLCNLPSGRTITIFFYDGPVSQEMAFGHILENGELFAARLFSAFGHESTESQLVNVATDGESYGHHRRFGDMALAYCLHHIGSKDWVRLTNYGEFLEKHPPGHLVEIHENSSWSCIHGVERWRENCGCNSGREGWTQAWRKPLRNAFNLLRDKLIPLFEKDASKYLNDPWRARNDYYEIITARSPDNIDRYFRQHASRELSHDEKVRVLELMEMQRNCMLMYTSCGWFFDEISGIETSQVLQYAAKAVQYGEKLFEIRLEGDLLKKLEKAPSNVLVNGAEAYKLHAKPAQLDLLRVGAHYSIFSLFTEHKSRTSLYCYECESDVYKRLESGKFKLSVGRCKISSALTWEESTVSFAVLHMGDHNVSGGVRTFMGEEAFSKMQNEITHSFDQGKMTDVIQLMLKHFGVNNYSVWHLFRDEQRKVLNQILQTPLREIEASLRKIYEESYPYMGFLRNLRNPLPAPFKWAAEYIINTDLQALFRQNELDPQKLDSLIKQAKLWGFAIDKASLSYIVSEWLNARFKLLIDNPLDNPALELFEKILLSLNPLQLELDLWQIQNAYFSLTRQYFQSEKKKADSGQVAAQRWVGLFASIGDQLKVKVES